MSNENINVALIGNPNTGKTSVFNQLTGLNQQVGNYPGITVEKKIGFCKLPHNIKANILDLPGTYSLNASSIDENVVIELLLNKNDKLFPDVAIVVTDVENLKRNLLLFTQIKDLEIPTILIIPQWICGWAFGLTKPGALASRSPRAPTCDRMPDPYRSGATLAITGNI